MKFPAEEIKTLAEITRSARQISIITHHRPDGDAMGSSLGLWNYFRRKNIKSVVVTPSDYPDFLNWLPGNNEVISYEKDGAAAVEQLRNSDLIFCLDFNWLSRTEELEHVIRNSAADKVLIDHHLDPEPAFRFIFSDTEACSTSELIYRFIDANADTSVIDKDIAECLYCGIMTDTNSFRYSSMKASVHRIVASLMDAGAENYKIHERVYDTNSENRLRLIGYSLKEKLTVLPEFKTAFLSLSESELQMFNFRSGDTEGLVNYALSIDGIRLAAFFSERDGMIKISFRSKGDFSVKELSHRFFEGGGHKNAAGGKSTLPLHDTVQRFIAILPYYKESLHQE
ncbi:MAG: bifunctional oligoribonuclease/PAP phosphatase NrnA [Bacteroidia bacterium]